MFCHTEGQQIFQTVIKTCLKYDREQMRYQEKHLLHRGNCTMSPMQSSCPSQQTTMLCRNLLRHEIPSKISTLKDQDLQPAHALQYIGNVFQFRMLSTAHRIEFHVKRTQQ